MTIAFISWGIFLRDGWLKILVPVVLLAVLIVVIFVFVMNM